MVHHQVLKGLQPGVVIAPPPPKKKLLVIRVSCTSFVKRATELRPDGGQF